MRSFQLHLALTAAFVSGAILIAFGFATGWLIKRQFIHSVDARLLVPVSRAYPHLSHEVEPNWRMLEREVGPGLGEMPWNGERSW